MNKVYCNDPVLVLNPSLEGISFSCFKGWCIDGVRYTLTSDHLFLIRDMVPWSRVFNIPFVSKPERKGCYSDKDYAKCLLRFNQFLDNSYFYDADGVATPIWTYVPCGKCDVCQSKKLFSYVQRCQFAYEESMLPAYFVTLTYNDKHLPKNPDKVDKYPFIPKREHLQRFFKRLRKLFDVLHLDNSLKYIYSSEFGKLGRPHFHLILFGFPLYDNRFEKRNLYYVRQMVNYAWRESYRNDDGTWYSFDDYLKEYKVVSNRPADYDPFSFGYANVSEISDTKVAAYVLKYVFKQSSEQTELISKDYNFKMFADDGSVLTPIPKFVTKFSYPDYTFHGCSNNLGLGFAQSFRDQLLASRDGEFEFVSFTGNTIKTPCCSYYLKKLFPSSSELIPVNVRRSLFFLINAVDDAVKLNIYKRADDLRHYLCALKEFWCHKLNFLLPTYFDDNPEVRFSEIWQVDYYNQSLFGEWPSEYCSSYLSLIDNCHIVLSQFVEKFDYADYVNKMVERDKFLCKFKELSSDVIYDRGVKYRQNQIRYRSKSFL